MCCQPHAPGAVCFSVTSEGVGFDQHTMKGQVLRRCAGKGLFVAGPWAVKWDTEWGGWEWSCFGLLGWTHRDRENEPWVAFFYLQCNSVQSFTACKPVQSFWSSSSTWRFQQGGALLLQACGDISSVGPCPTPKTLGEIMAHCIIGYPELWGRDPQGSLKSRHCPCTGYPRITA